MGWIQILIYIMILGGDNMQVLSNYYIYYHFGWKKAYIKVECNKCVEKNKCSGIPCVMDMEC
jgi:hypothetical protein